MGFPIDLVGDSERGHDSELLDRRGGLRVGVAPAGVLQVAEFVSVDPERLAAVHELEAGAATVAGLADVKDAVGATLVEGGAFKISEVGHGWLLFGTICSPQDEMIASIVVYVK